MAMILAMVMSVAVIESFGPGAGAGARQFLPPASLLRRRRCATLRMDFQEMTPEQRFLVDMTG